MVGVSLTGHRRLSLRMLLVYAAGTLLAVVRPTLLYTAVTTQAGAWAALVGWWRAAVVWPDHVFPSSAIAPGDTHHWSDALLFGVLTTVVHEGLYFGAWRLVAGKARRERGIVRPCHCWQQCLMAVSASLFWGLGQAGGKSPPQPMSCTPTIIRRCERGVRIDGPPWVVSAVQDPPDGGAGGFPTAVSINHAGGSRGGPPSPGPLLLPHVGEAGVVQRV